MRYITSCIDTHTYCLLAEHTSILKRSNIHMNINFTVVGLRILQLLDLV